MAKRILQVVSSMNRGGLETYIMNLYRHIDRSKVQFDFLVHTTKHCAYDDEIRNLGGKIYSVTSRGKSILRNKLELHEFFKTHKEYDTIHIHISCPTYIAPIVYAKRNGVKKIIVHSRNNVGAKGKFHDICRFLNKPRIKKYATHYFAISNLAADNMYHKNISREQIKIIPNAIDSEKFIFSKDIRAERRRAYGVEDKFVVGHVGRFAEQKNHMFLLETFKEIYEQCPNAVLMLVGEGSLEDKIRAKAQALDIEEAVLFMGTFPDVENVMQAMDVFLCPSLFEGFGRVLLEAQASGLPTFTSKRVVPDIIKVTELLEFISLEESPKVWAEHVLKYQKGYERYDMSQKIKAANFDMKALATYFEDFYRDMEA